MQLVVQTTIFNLSQIFHFSYTLVLVILYLNKSFHLNKILLQLFHHKKMKSVKEAFSYEIFKYLKIKKLRKLQF